MPINSLIRYDASTSDRIPVDANPVFQTLARSFIVEFEPPRGTPSTLDWFVQVRLPGQPVFAGYYGETAIEAATKVLNAISPTSIRTAA